MADQSNPIREKVTTHTLREMKERGEKITALTAYDYSTAVFLNESGIDVILVGDSLAMVVKGYKTTLKVTLDEIIEHSCSVARGNKTALLIGDMPFLTFTISIAEAVRNAGRLVQEGEVEAVKIEGGVDIAATAAAIVKAGIPVLGHIGFTPQHILKYGKSKVAPKTEETTQRLLKDAKALENAGVFGIVLECLPLDMAKEITKSVSVPTIGIGSGQYCDGQILVTNELLGIYDEMKLKFVKRYANLHKIMTDAFDSYISEVRQGIFPDEEHSFKGTK
jgi:3-methyl-2-oxobutanoate hydroxymethyltransferase